MRKLLLASASILVWSGVASAQTDSLVTVNIQDVLQDIAVELSVEETSIPVNVQLPVSVAASVCDVDVNALSVQVESGDATCVAVTGSQELTQVVQQQVASGGDDEDNDDTASDSTTDEQSNGNDTASDGNTDHATDDNVADTGEDTDEIETGSTNSARELAPGRSDNAPPGQTDDPQANAPGQLKQECPDGETCE